MNITLGTEVFLSSFKGRKSEFFGPLSPSKSIRICSVSRIGAFLTCVQEYCVKCSTRPSRKDRTRMYVLGAIANEIQSY